MKILVLGATGMAGHIISLHLREQGHTVDTIANKGKLDSKPYSIDLTNKEEFERFLQKKSYDVIVNCVGILIEMSEARKDLSTYLNSFLPHLLEEKFKETSTKIIHLSTDCVFSGENGPYKEDSLQDGKLFYDKTKALGEIINKKDLTFRMSIIGPDMTKEGVGLFNWFMKQNGEIYGYSNVMWNGITTLELAKAIDVAIKEGLTGLYHLVPKETVSKLELLRVFQEVFNREDLVIKPKDSTPSNKILVNTRKDFSYKVNNYPTMIKEMGDWIKAHSPLYPHYKSN